MRSTAFPNPSISHFLQLSFSPSAVTSASYFLKRHLYCKQQKVPARPAILGRPSGNARLRSGLACTRCCSKRIAQSSAVAHRPALVPSSQSVVCRQRATGRRRREAETAFNYCREMFLNVVVMKFVYWLTRHSSHMKYGTTRRQRTGKRDQEGHTKPWPPLAKGNPRARRHHETSRNLHAIQTVFPSWWVVSRN